MFSLALHCKALIGKLLLEICNIISDVEIMTSHARKRTNIWSWYDLIIHLQVLVVFLKIVCKVLYKTTICNEFFRGSSSFYHHCKQGLLRSIPLNTCSSSQYRTNILYQCLTRLKIWPTLLLVEDKRAKGSSFKLCNHTLANTLGLTDNLCYVYEELCQRFHLKSGFPDLHTSP